MERDVMLGPLFTLGVVLVAAGIVRRSWPLAGAGAAAIAADQKLPLARRLNSVFREALEPKLG